MPSPDPPASPHMCAFSNRKLSELRKPDVQPGVGGRASRAFPPSNHTWVFLVARPIPRLSRGPPVSPPRQERSRVGKGFPMRD